VKANGYIIFSKGAGIWTFMKIVIIGIVMVVVGCIILGWLIKESYKNLKGASTKLTGSLLGCKNQFHNTFLT
jgi:hypothetical protein